MCDKLHAPAALPRGKEPHSWSDTLENVGISCTCREPTTLLHLPGNKHKLSPYHHTEQYALTGDAIYSVYSSSAHRNTCYSRLYDYGTLLSSFENILNYLQL
jgi:hypothetical protein